MRLLGKAGRMFLAGTSVYSHPDGPSSGVRAIIAAYRAFSEEGVADLPGLKRYAASKGKEGKPLARALG
jgi:ribulose 1,5-bisphosphate carboxylase large subunit-like protein